MDDEHGGDAPKTPSDESVPEPHQKRSRINEDELDAQASKAKDLIASPSEPALRLASSPLPADDESAFASLSDATNLSLDGTHLPSGGLPQTPLAQPQLHHLQQLQFAQIQQLQQLQALWYTNPIAAFQLSTLGAGQAVPPLLSPFATLASTPFALGSSALFNGGNVGSAASSIPIGATPLPFLLPGAAPAAAAVPTMPTGILPTAASFAPKPQHKKALDQMPPDADYTFHKAGGAKANTRRFVLRQVWKCASQPCSAQWTAEVSYSSEAAIVSWNSSGEHSNHDKTPPRARVTPEMRNRVKELVMMGNAKPAQLHQQLVLEAAQRTGGGEIGEGEVPTRRQLETIKYRATVAGMPHGRDRVANLLALYKAELRLSNLSPPRYVYMADWQVNVAGESHYLFVDTTFDLVEDKLKLTTLLAQPLTVDMLVPLAWCIHSGMDAAEYTHLFRSVVDASTSCSLKMRLSAIFTDFDLSLRNALQAVWSGIPHHGDLFHFLQAIRRWCVQHGQDAIANEAQSKARELATTRPDAAFRNKLVEFSTFWKTKSVAFWEYFEQQWLKRTSSGQWALSARAEGLPTGDQALEGYNNRLATTVFKGRTKVALDLAMKFLHEEAAYYCAIMKNKALATAHLRERELIRARADASRPSPRLAPLSVPPPPLLPAAQVDASASNTDDAALAEGDLLLPLPGALMIMCCFHLLFLAN